MKMGKGLEIVVSTAFGVGLFAFFAGYCFATSSFAGIYADMADDLADEFAPVYGSENVQSLRDSAKDLRNGAMELRDYGMYATIGTILIGVGGAGWMAWKFRKAEQESALAPTPVTAPPGTEPAIK